MRIDALRQTLSGAAILSAAAILLAGCGPSASPSGAVPPAPTAAAAVATTSSQVLGATAVPAQTSSGQPTISGERVNGTVQAVDPGKITLTDGKILTLSPDTPVIQMQPASAADLKPNDYVAITATRESDGSLLASAVNIFAESQRGVAAGQRPLTGGNLMTNATIATVNGDTFTATFPGGTATVKLGPGAKVQRFASVSQGDIKPGMMVSALVVDGIARAITLQ